MEEYFDVVRAPAGDSEHARTNHVSNARKELMQALPFVLSPSQKESANQRLKSVFEHGQLPSGLRPSRLWEAFDGPKSFKAHDFVLLGGPLIMYAIEDLLGPDEAQAYGMMFEAINRLWAKSFKRSELESLKKLMHRALLRMHVQLPSVHHDIIMHMLHHIVDSIDELGPPWSHSMWAMEARWRKLRDANNATKYADRSMMLAFRAQCMSCAVMEKQEEAGVIDIDERVILPLSLHDCLYVYDQGYLSSHLHAMTSGQTLESLTPTPAKLVKLHAPSYCRMVM